MPDDFFEQRTIESASLFFTSRKPACLSPDALPTLGFFNPRARGPTAAAYARRHQRSSLVFTFLHVSHLHFHHPEHTPVTRVQP